MATGDREDDRWNRFERELPTSLVRDTRGRPAMSLRELMELYRVPGLSLAVVDEFRVTLASAYGVAQGGTAVRMTPRTPLQVGSVSKPVAAASALRMVDRGSSSSTAT